MMKLIGLILATLLLTACNAGKDQTNIEIVRGMMDQVSIKAQDWDPNNPNEPMMKEPPQGTIPRGYKPFNHSFASAGKELRNPLAGDFTPDVLELGKSSYMIYCSMCHGDNGDGQGRIADKMVILPPTLLSPRVKKEYRDGNLYHVIMKGFGGGMRGYSTQIRDERTRWALVNYVRHMQKSAR